MEKIYTLDWIVREAEGIAGSWNGQDDTFEYEGEVYSAEQADSAQDILRKVEELKALCKEAGI